MHNLKTDELIVFIVLWSRDFLETKSGPGELKGNHKLILSTQWQIVKTDGDSFPSTQDATLLTPGAHTASGKFASYS